MIYGLRILPSADSDADDCAAFIAAGSVDHAMRFYDSLNLTYKSILGAPQLCPVYPFAQTRLKDIRRKAVLKFDNYLVFYRIDADMVEIVRVLHAARDIPSVFAELDQ